jgi:hypothetical protein
MKIFLLGFVLLISSLHLTWAAEVSRPLAFDVPASCTCASCSFDTYRVLSKFEGVKKVTLSGKDHRLKVQFVEGKQPVSALALKLEHLELGKGSSLLWPVLDSIEISKATAALSRISGIAAATADAKDHTVHLTFAAQAAVTIPQLDNALQGLTSEAHQ